MHPNLEINRNFLKPFFFPKANLKPIMSIFKWGKLMQSSQNHQGRPFTLQADV